MAGPPPLKRPRPEVVPVAVETTRALIGDFSVNALARNGVYTREFLWLLPISSVQLRSGRLVENGFCAGTGDGHVHIFRYTDIDGFRFMSAPLADVQPGYESAGDAATLTLAVTSEGPIRSITIVIAPSVLGVAVGDWFALWRPTIAASLGVPLASLGLVSVDHWTPAINGFGKRKVKSIPAALCGISDGQPLFFPPIPVPPLKVQRWSASEDRLAILVEDESVPAVIEIREYAVASKRPFIGKLATSLDGELRTNQTLPLELSSLGVFQIQFSADLPPQNVVLEKLERGLSVRPFIGAESITWSEGFVYRDSTILFNSDGVWGSVAIPEEKGLQLIQILDQSPERQATTDEVFSTVLLRDDGRILPVKVSIISDALVLGLGETFSLQSTRKLEVLPLEDRFCSVTITVDNDGATQSIKLIAPEAIAYKMWQEWDVRRTAASVEHAGVADLYKQFCEAKKFSLLSALFADVVLLNRKLNSQISMDDLLIELDAKGPVEFSEDKRLREITISKMVLLISVLPRIKQKFELLAAMYPYYWAHEEARWIESIFGKERVAAAVNAQTRRIVPVVRREVRSMQANVQRALSEIEAALRPLDGLFAREEVQKSGWSKLRRWAPVGVKAVAAGMMVANPAAVSAMLVSYIGAFLAGDVLGNVCGIFLKDSEAHSQFQRAAKSVFPWWQIFMRTLVISIYETAQFIDDENIRAMKRDKQLFEQVAATEKAATLQTLSSELRKRIVQERRSYFAEIGEGTGIRLATVINDIQQSIGREVNEFVDEFVKGVALPHGT